MSGAMRTMKMMLAVAIGMSALTTPILAQDIPQWVKKLKLSGDIGARTEYISDSKSADEYDRVRERARFRLGLETSPVDKVNVAFGIETSGTNPTSGWADYTDFQNQPLYLAHAYLQYRPSDHVTLSGGKLKSGVPFWKPVQLVWKNDVNPYGVAINYTTDMASDVKFFANGGVFALTEHRDYEYADDIPMNAILVVQPGVEAQKGRLRVKGAFTIQQFSLTNHGTSTWIKSPNSFTLLDPSWEVSYKVGKIYAATFSGEFSHNINGSVDDIVGDDADKNTNAYLLSFGFGHEKVNKFKAWQLKAAYRRLEDNAIPRGFGQTSAYNADPGKGWECTAALGLLKDLSFNATFYNMTDLDGHRPQLVSQFDVIYKF